MSFISWRNRYELIIIIIIKTVYNNNNNNNGFWFYYIKGNGKSSLGNFILGTQAFSVSDNPESETKITCGQYGVNENQGVFVIDTPGKFKLKTLIFNKINIHIINY